jgi:lipopolysaccharide export system permease protein
MKKLDWYIVKKFLGTFFYAILIMAVIASVIDYSEKMDDFMTKNIPASIIFTYYKNFIPHITALLFPLFIFIATIFFTSKMAYKSEIIAILASGTSYQRFLRPYVIGAVFLSFISYLANHLVVPVANKERIEFEDGYMHYNKWASEKDLHLRVTKDLYIYLGNYEFHTNSGSNFTAEIIEGTLLKEKLIADRIIFDTVKNQWNLTAVRIRTNDGLKETLRFVNDTSIKYPFKPADLEEDDAIKEALTTSQLNTYIDRERLRGRENLNFFLIEKYRRTAQPVAAFILTIIGVCLSSRKVRGGSGLHLALGIIISASYIMSMQFTNTFSTKAGLNPLLAAWIPNIIFGAIAFYLYRRQIK